MKGQAYAAVLVDLPRITEGMKIFDRKSCYKSTNICQMSLVFQAVANDKELCQGYKPQGDRRQGGGGGAITTARRRGTVFKVGASR